MTEHIARARGARGKGLRSKAAKARKADAGNHAAARAETPSYTAPDDTELTR